MVSRGVISIKLLVFSMLAMRCVTQCRKRAHATSHRNSIVQVYVHRALHILHHIHYSQAYGGPYLRSALRKESGSNIVSNAPRWSDQDISYHCGCGSIRTSLSPVCFDVPGVYTVHVSSMMCLQLQALCLLNMSKYSARLASQTEM
jgi:hypothetical protein